MAFRSALLLGMRQETSPQTSVSSEVRLMAAKWAADSARIYNFSYEKDDPVSELPEHWLDMRENSRNCATSNSNYGNFS
jgi:hypothetical protein